MQVHATTRREEASRDALPLQLQGDRSIAVGLHIMLAANIASSVLKVWGAAAGCTAASVREFYDGTSDSCTP